ncbi:MAG: Phosphorylase, partial [uncultured bacterium]
RVQQYHVTGMFSLGAFIKALESKYQIFKNVRGKIFGGTVPENIPADYSNDASYPVKIDETKVFESEILFKDKNVRIKVEEGINSEGVSVLLITDLPDQNGQYPLGKSYFKRMFKYAQNAEEEKEFPQMIEFSTFMGKASWEYVKNKYREEWKKDKKNWKAPVVNVNDAQTILVPVYRAVDYYGALNEARKAQKEERWEDAKNWLEEAEYLRSFFISATTHTYRNKGFFGFYSEWFRNKLIESGIPEEFHVYFASNAPEGTELPMAGNVNLTSAGLKLADCAKAVAGLHAHEVWEYDTVLEKLHGVTNGDIIRNSTKYFRQYLEKINPKAFKKNPDYYKSPSADDVSRTKKEAKKELKSIQHNGDELEINPEQLVVSYSGRWVEEKRSSRAFNFINIRDGHRYLNLDPSTNNIIKLVEQGVQVVIFGNVQDYDKELGELGKAMEAYINKLIKEDPKKYTGKFIFKDKFNLEEQLKLLAASDIQIQDSDRSTGASEYTESNATANGAINMGSPYHEGVINKHGELMNFLKEGVGNSIVPVNEDPDSYYDQIINVNKLFKQGRLKFWQATSIKESQILEAIQTSAEYLRIWNSYFDVDSSTGKANYLSRTIPKPISLNYEGANNAEAAFNNTLEPVKIKWSWIKSANSEGEETIHNYNTSDWSFDATSKDNLTLYVELEEFKDDYNYGADYFIYLRGTDGKKFPVNAMFDKEKRRFSFDIPKYFSGKYELFLATPAKAFKFPQRILIREPKVEVPQIVEKKITNDSTVYIIRFPKDMGSDYHMTLSIPGLKPWESVFPGDILFNGRDLKHVADSRAELPGTVKRTLKPSSNARVNAYELVLTIPNGINATDLLIAPV